MLRKSLNTINSCSRQVYPRAVVRVSGGTSIALYKIALSTGVLECRCS